MFIQTCVCSAAASVALIQGFCAGQLAAAARACTCTTSATLKLMNGQANDEIVGIEAEGCTAGHWGTPICNSASLSLLQHVRHGKSNISAFCLQRYASLSAGHQHINMSVQGRGRVGRTCARKARASKTALGRAESSRARSSMGSPTPRSAAMRFLRPHTLAAICAAACQQSPI